MTIPRRRLLELGLGAAVAGLAEVPEAALARSRRHPAPSGHARQHGHAARSHPGALAHAKIHPHHPGRGEVRLAADHRPHPAKGALILSEDARRVRFHNLHTDEKLDAVYYERGAYVPDALSAVNHVLRDFRTGDVHPMDPALLDVLAALSARLETSSPVHVISGYRSPRTNSFLRAEGGAESGVARKSLHMQGQAIDIRLADVGLDRVHRAALDLRRGGVGYYPISNFVHVDVGAVRQWGGI
jgi:uncharacterized protein YcbK (DUF882 family)